jgi:3-deoxy-7-phosphoheptulonate synthase
MDGSHLISKGLGIARDLLCRMTELNLPVATEMLDPITPEYLADMLCFGAIGARTTESQTHRELASGLSFPIGFKNGTDGNVRIACDAIHAASRPHHFLGVHKSGQVAMVRTRGNPDCHIILRGGAAPNYDEASVAAACATLGEAGLGATLMVDCSHANCGKQHERQLDVVREIARQVAAGSRRVFGAMIESHLNAGAQKFTPGRDDPAALAWGVSITDPCLGWESTVEALETLAAAVRRRRG